MLKRVFAFNSSWLRNQKAEPWSWLVPDLVTTVIAAPPAMPWSASKLLVETLTVSIVSAGLHVAHVVGQPDVHGHRAVDAGRVGCSAATPFTQVRSERPGVSISAFWNCAGVAPGTRFDQLSGSSGTG